MSTPTAAGWYDDPDHPDQLRYFDGIVWTTHTTPRRTREVVAPVVPPVAPPPAPPTGSDPYGWRGGPTDQQQAPPTYGAPPPSAPPPGVQSPYGQHGGQPPSGQQGWPGPQQQQWQQTQQAYPTGPTTPDGVPLAGYGQRIGAYILDALLQGAITAVLGGYFLWRALKPWWDQFLAAVEANDSTAIENLSNNVERLINGTDLLIFVLISVAVGLIYNIGFLHRVGATPGKMALGISVRERDRPGPLPLAGRRYLINIAVAILTWIPGTLGLLLSLLGLVDVLWPLWDDKRQALHDKIASTNVVRGKQPRSPGPR